MCVGEPWYMPEQLVLEGVSVLAILGEVDLLQVPLPAFLSLVLSVAGIARMQRRSHASCEVVSEASVFRLQENADGLAHLRVRAQVRDNLRLVAHVVHRGEVSGSTRIEARCGR